MADVFDKVTAKYALLGGLVMSTSDDDADDEEFGIVRTFIKDHWNREWGDVGHVIDQVTDVKHQLFGEPELKDAHLKRFAETLAEAFDAQQASLFLGFLYEVMKADGIEDPDEFDIYTLFKDALEQA